VSYMKFGVDPIWWTPGIIMVPGGVHVQVEIEMSLPTEVGFSRHGAWCSSVVAGDRDREVEVLAKAQRRRFTAEYKRRVLQEAEACRKPGELGALLRARGCTPRICPLGELPILGVSWPGSGPGSVARRCNRPIRGISGSPNWSGNSNGPRRAADSSPSIGGQVRLARQSRTACVLRNEIRRGAWGEARRRSLGIARNGDS